MGNSSASGPMIARAWATCSTVPLAGCAPAVRGEDALVDRHAVLVEFVEVGHQRFVRLAVLLVGFGMADPDAEHKPARIGGVDAMERVGDGLGGRRPDVDDPGGNLRGGRRLQNRLDKRQLGGRRTADPNGAVAEPFDLLSVFQGGTNAEVAESAEVGGAGL
jgi:hypothetical protein